MAILPILVEGDARLTHRALEVVAVDAPVRAAVDDLVATLVAFREKAGFGRAIAAPQVGIGLRIIAMHLGATPFALINPEIVWRSEATMEVWDDCLSVPDRLVRVRRHRSISVRHLDEQGRVRLWEKLPEDLSELVQHEMDHLEGVLMTQRACGVDAVRPMADRAALGTTAGPRHRLSLEAIREASRTIDPVFLHTPQYVCEPLSAALGCRLVTKVETFNPIRSFKGRGADYFLQRVRARGADAHRALVCASAGNWGQAMAYVGRARGEPVKIFAAASVNPLKAERMRALGAVLHLEGEDFDAAKALARDYCAREGAWLVEDGCEPEISEGAGTMAVELLAGGWRLDAVLIPLGNGAMINGMARWIKAASPATRVIGVAAAGAPAMAQSWRARAPVLGLQVATIADGVAVRVPVPEAVADMDGLVDDVLLVDDATLVQAMRLVHTHMGLILEPSGALGVAAVLANRAVFAERKVATVLCGGNLPPGDVRRLLC